MPKKTKVVEKDTLINTYSPSRNTQKDLLLLLSQLRNHHFFFRDTFEDPSTYQINVTDKIRGRFFFNKITRKTINNIKLTNTLIKFKRRKDPSQYRWAVLGDQIGHGSQGIVYNIIATIYIHHDSLVVKQKSTRIVKTMAPRDIQLSDQIYRNSADHEFKMMNRLPFIYHPHLVVHDKAYSLDALISQRFENCGLDTLLYYPEKIDKLSLSEKISLCRFLLKELNLLHDAGIVHRDIKPENIIIELSSENIVSSVKIIDLGFAKESAIDSSGIDQPGTVYFASPEVFQRQPANKPADIFAMGRIFWMVFGCHDSVIDFLKNKNLITLTASGEMPARNDLFQNSMLGVELQRKLYALFVSMNCKNPQERASIAFCLEQLDSISLAADKDATSHPDRSPSHLFFSFPTTAPAMTDSHKKNKERLIPAEKPLAFLRK